MLLQDLLESNTQQFMQLFDKATQASPVSRARILVHNDQPVAQASVAEFAGNIYVSNIKSFVPGGGNHILKLMTQLADDTDTVLELVAEPIDKKTLSKDQLVAWYMRNGFAMINDNTYRMQRLPNRPKKIKLRGFARKH